MAKELTVQECDGMCLTGSDVGVPTSAIAYAHPGCPLHDPGGRCGCGNPARCNSPSHHDEADPECPCVRCLG